jgi:hypothetical protein
MNVWCWAAIAAWSGAIVGGQCYAAYYIARHGMGPYEDASYYHIPALFFALFWPATLTIGASWYLVDRLMQFPRRLGEQARQRDNERKQIEAVAIEELLK